MNSINVEYAKSDLFDVEIDDYPAIKLFIKYVKIKRSNVKEYNMKWAVYDVDLLISETENYSVINFLENADLTTKTLKLSCYTREGGVAWIKNLKINAFTYETTLAWADGGGGRVVWKVNLQCGNV